MHRILLTVPVPSVLLDFLSCQRSKIVSRQTASSKMLKFGALLNLFSILILLAAVHGITAIRFEEPVGVTDEVPLDFLMFSSGRDVEAMFGFEIIEYLHRERMKCSISRSKEELKYTEKMEQLMRYFKHAKQTIIQPGFEVLASENKKDIEENFHRAFKDMEVNHLRKLSRMQNKCDAKIESYMEERLQLIMDYATTMLHAEKAEFSKLLANMIAYQAQLENGLNFCISYMERNSMRENFEKAGMYFDLCYGNEVLVLEKFITKFAILARELAGVPSERGIVQLPAVKPDTTIIEVHEIVPEEPKPVIDPVEENEVIVEEPKPEIEPLPEDLEDDEDIDYEPSGKGEPKEMPATPPTKIVDESTTENEVPKEIIVEEPKPEVEPPPEDLEGDEDIDYEPSGKGEPEETPATPPTKIVDSSTTAVPELTTTASPIHKGTEVKPTGPPQKPETSTKSDSLATTDDLKLKISKEPEGSNIGEEGFQRVKAMQDAAGKEDSSSERSRSSSKSDTEENSDPGLSIDLELPGIDVEIDESGVKVDAQGVGEGVIIFDPVATTEAPEHEHHGKHDFKTMFFIYFFATLGVLLAITLVVLLIVIVRVKMTRSTSSRKKDPPLLSEEDKITVLKQSGYVNPTYKFFDEVKDV